ncbi:protein involved in polysaccharide export, contains SLBB domain of the beta-grasp fold [Algoriphagus alkaliphilus]|uniref:Protein involved in polysaccharide export, contains SLBB domain of the beta-grasp fold n=1 Tax=Algoriphagus alkaliphilus TaxID=279824 RepID=A0A1G5Y8M6_9BACT|nr:SLBB domain-containing protein [Algoriphagus alkaliphilus]SDA78377.1 protein involved in polysaccharide export, contains SLBB domain of the beta-grasp fold [Algoriphagus alkaliphilus]
MKDSNIRYFSRVVFLWIIFFLFIGSVWAQNLSNLSTLKVDNLSDAQIEQLIKRAESSGLTPSQLEGMAREQGLSPIEANKLRQRIMGLQKTTNPQSAQNTTSGIRESTSQTQSDLFDSLRRSDPYYDLTPFQKKIFGYKLFHNRDLDFNPSLNIPTPQGYIVGSGDQLLIDVYGASQESFDLNVSPEGRILIPNVGSIQVGGASIEAATSRLKSSLGRIYSGLLGSNPNTFIQVRLGNIRSIKVSMVGELSRPGTYTLPSFASVFNGLFAAGGPNENGSFRNIQVYRDSRLVATVDIYEFLSKGNSQSNITLQDNDVVIVPPVQARVEVVGPVRREGFFEVKPDDTLSDLELYTGGFTSQAFKDRQTIRRIENNERKVIDVSREDFSTFNPKDGDEILIGVTLDRFVNRVQISGAVIRPGEYALENGVSVKNLIERAQGLKPEAFVNRATLYRTSEDLTLAAMPLDLKGIMDGTQADVQLKNEDLLFIPSRYDIQEETYVKISGEVNIPSTYPYASSMTVGDLILQAGGLLQSASNSSIEIARRVRDASSGKLAELFTISINPDLKLSEEESRLPLMPFDHVFIRKSPGFEREKLIRVEGEINYPGEFAISSANERISDVIKRAGGLNQFAYPKGASLVRRTVYFKDVTPEEIQEKNLRTIREKVDPERNPQLNQAELLLFERLDGKINAIEEKKLIEEQRKIMENLNKNSISDSLSRDSLFNKVRFKKQDVIGINLEEILRNPGTGEDLILQEGDILRIPKELQTIRMVGEVLMPTTARFVRNNNLRNYISQAGGFTEEARKSKTYVIYANGDARRTHALLMFKFYPQIEPGAEIVVPKKPQRERLSTAAWLGIASSLATLGILVQSLVNSN